jgi:Flp pilus assembly protein TadG
MTQSRPHAARGRRLAREDGQAYVEFAFVLPILLLVVMGIIQFGVVFKDYIALTDATRVGARQAAVSRSITDPNARIPLIEAKMRDAAGTLDTDQMTIDVSLWDPVNGVEDWAAGGDVTVRASYPLKVNLFGLVVFDSTINSRTTERVE